MAVVERVWAPEIVSVRVICEGKTPQLDARQREGWPAVPNGFFSRVDVTREGSFPNIHPSTAWSNEP
jgi:hypothetical protein